MQEGSTTGASARGAAPVVRLNAFQVLMRRWAKMHPYNAGQVMRVSGEGDVARWKAAVESVIQEMRLGGVEWVRRKSDSRVRFVPVEGVTVEQSDLGFEGYFNRELNRKFEKGELPVRFCVLPAPPTAVPVDHPSHYLAMVYDHWIGDSRAMRGMMERIFARYQKPGDRSLVPLTVEAPPFERLFGKYMPKPRLLWAWAESTKGIFRHRHAYRLNLWKPLDFTSNFYYRVLPEGLIGKLHAFAKANGGSVNDLFTAVIAQTMGQYTAWDRLTRKVRPLHFARRQIGIGTIVDIREAASEPTDNVFGLYLSSFTVVMTNPEQRELGALTGEVAAQTREMKKPAESVKNYLKLVYAKFLYDLVGSRKIRAKLMHKNVSVVAGISNVNMTKSWANPPAETLAAGEPRILDYLRISPTGPLIPLVFTLTTIGGRLSLCVTFRTTCMHPPAAMKIMEEFMARLCRIGSGG